MAVKEYAEKIAIEPLFVPPGSLLFNRIVGVFSVA
jgi:hypothetical protein